MLRALRAVKQPPAVRRQGAAAAQQVQRFFASQKGPKQQKDTVDKTKPELSLEQKLALDEAQMRSFRNAIIKEDGSVGQTKSKYKGEVMNKDGHF